MRTQHLPALRARVMRIREVATYCRVKTHQVWDWCATAHEGFPPAIVVTPSLIVWDEVAVHNWYRCHITRRLRALGK